MTAISYYLSVTQQVYRQNTSRGWTLFSPRLYQQMTEKYLNQYIKGNDRTSFYSLSFF